MQHMFRFICKRSKVTGSALYLAFLLPQMNNILCVTYHFIIQIKILYNEQQIYKLFCWSLYSEVSVLLNTMYPVNCISHTTDDIQNDD